MRLIQQRNWNDCGVAVAAMVAGVSYREADAMVEPAWQVEDRGMHLHEIIRLMEALTKHRWTASKRGYRRSLVGYEAHLPRCACALLLRDPDEDWGHFVAFDGTFIYDPECAKRVRLGFYDKGDNLLIRQLLPLDVARRHHP